MKKIEDNKYEFTSDSEWEFCSMCEDENGTDGVQIVTDNALVFLSLEELDEMHELAHADRAVLIQPCK